MTLDVHMENIVDFIFELKANKIEDLFLSLRTDLTPLQSATDEEILDLKKTLDNLLNNAPSDSDFTGLDYYDVAIQIVKKSRNIPDEYDYEAIDYLSEDTDLIDNDERKRLMDLANKLGVEIKSDDDKDDEDDD